MKKILIIEDELEVRENLSELISLNNYEVKNAENGNKALELLNNYMPDLILSDISMPGIDGFQLLKLIKNAKKLTHVPFVFLTAKTEKIDFRKAMNLGADDYVFKPIKTKELLQVIEKRITKVEQEKKFYEEKIKITYNKLNKTAAHEFNTPLNGILGFAELIKTNPNLEIEKIKYFAQNIFNQGLRLKNTLEKIMIYRQIISKTIICKNENIELSYSYLKQLTLKLAEKYKRKNDFIIEFFKTILINIKLCHLEIILFEIIDNAFKFSQKQSTVFISVKVVGNICYIYISDAGRGISEKQLTKISAFKQFERKKYEQQGLGLGLFNAIKLTEIYKGKLKIQSSHNTGTKIIIEFPIKQNFIKL